MWGNETTWKLCMHKDELQFMHVCRKGIIACNNNNMRNPMKQNVGRGYACCYCCMQGHYNLVSLIFGTTIPTSFNILMKCFLHLFHSFFLGIISSNVHFEFCFFVDCFTIPTCLFYILFVAIMSQQEYCY